MITIELALLVLALVAFVVDTVGVVSRVKLQSLGLSLLVLAMLLRGRT